ncbi:hypothetical protein [Burkholderia cenocepacia]|uniref:hypothetical protein n=1 Tax=Burkholderia cenocepacia TaxID=95486 RepID=UPI00209B35DC|nr:hypothetical protein [Burkholderia cenocepacia]
MAILCSTDALLVIEQKPARPPVQARYWEKFMKGDSRVEGQHALRQLAWNADALGLDRDGVAVLKRTQKFFHPFSHCGRIAIASRGALEHPGRFHIGGHFEEAKLGGYRLHMERHIGLCEALPEWLDYLLRTLDSTPAAPMVVPAAGNSPNPPAAA